VSPRREVALSPVAMPPRLNPRQSEGIPVTARRKCFGIKSKVEAGFQLLQPVQALLAHASRAKAGKRRRPILFLTPHYLWNLWLGCCHQRQVQHIRPELEVLESRTVLSTIADLDTLTGRSFVPVAINDSGQIAGNSHVSLGVGDGFLYSNGVTKDLGGLSIFGSAAEGMNASGQVVGTSFVSSFSAHAFLYSNGLMSDLGMLLPPETLGGSSVAYSINSSGQVVGYSPARVGLLTPDHAFLYSGGQMIDLNSQLPINSSWSQLTDAVSINGSGEIVGNGIDNGQARGFLDDGGSITDLGTLGGASSTAAATAAMGSGRPRSMSAPTAMLSGWLTTPP